MGETTAARFRVLMDDISLFINGIMSWSAWVPILLFGSLTGLYFGRQELVMLLLTIQTSIDAAATKTLQNHVRQADHKKDELLTQQISDTATLIVELRRQNDLMIDMLNAAQRRDELSAKRDKMILTALEAQSNLHDYLGKEVVEKREPSRKASSSAVGKRKAHGRTARKKS